MACLVSVWVSERISFSWTNEPMEPLLKCMELSSSSSITFRLGKLNVWVGRYPSIWMRFKTTGRMDLHGGLSPFNTSMSSCNSPGVILCLPREIIMRSNCWRIPAEESGWPIRIGFNSLNTIASIPRLLKTVAVGGWKQMAAVRVKTLRKSWKRADLSSSAVCHCQ